MSGGGALVRGFVRSVARDFAAASLMGGGKAWLKNLVVSCDGYWRQPRDGARARKV